MNEKFICKACGKCCSKIRGRLDKEEEAFLRKNAFGQMPLVQMVPLEKTSFPLWDWEARRFMEWQKEVRIDAKIAPSRAVFDLSRNKTIIVTYYMDRDSCAFMKEGKCLIYNKHRAFICRLYPFQRTPFLNVNDKETPETLLSTCTVITQQLKKIPREKKAMIKWFNEYFQDGSFLNAVQNDIVTEWINKTLVELCKNKVIRPAMNYPYDKLLKRIENSEKIDLTEFLVQEKIKSKEEINNLIKRFDNNLDAKDKIKEALK